MSAFCHDVPVQLYGRTAKTFREHRPDIASPEKGQGAGATPAAMSKALPLCRQPGNPRPAASTRSLVHVGMQTAAPIPCVDGWIRGGQFRIRRGRACRPHVRPIMEKRDSLKAVLLRAARRAEQSGRSRKNARASAGESHLAR